MPVGGGPASYGAVVRPRLFALLDEGSRRRLLTVVADAGFGKSTLLGSWAAERPCAWYTVRAEDRPLAAMVTGLVESLRRQVPALSEVLAAELQGPRGPDADAEQETRALAYAAVLADALEQHLDGDLVLVLDDLHELNPGDPATRLIEGLIRIAPPSLHLVVASRTPMPFGIDRLRGRGQVLEIDATALAFTVAETRAVLHVVLGDGSEELAEPLQAAVQGWPAAARLAVEALRTVPGSERQSRLRRALRSDGPLYDYLAEEVFAAEPPAVRRLVAAVAVLPRFGTELCQAIGLTDSAAMLQQLRTRGLLVSAGDEDGYELNPLVRDFAIDRLSADEVGMDTLVLRAGEWFESVGDHRDALACYQAVEPAHVARMLTERGHAMVSGGLAETVVGAVSALPEELRDAAMDQLEGEARQVLGDWQGAEDCFGRIIAPEGEIPVGIAWRLGLIHHLRGRTDIAVATYQRGRIDGQQPTDEALLQAWWAGAHWLRGEFDECRRLIAAAEVSAKVSGDDRALAIVHTVLAMLAAVDSDPRGNASHYVRALEHAERAGDLLQSIRIRVNRASHHIAEGDYILGLDELERALELADRAGFAVFRALALNNRGEALLRLGRLDEAIGELEASRALYQKLESKRVAQPLAVLGEVYRERGDRAMARACYEEAITMAEDTKDMQALVPSLAGLARVLAVEEPERAAELAEIARQAVAYGPVPGLSGALVALGWVTLHAGNKTEAAAAAEESAALCRKRRDRAGLADALELYAAADGGEVLHEVLNIRNELGDPLGQARAELMLARRTTGAEGRELALRAHQQFLAAGATRYAAAALAASEETRPAPVRIECLGGFRVLRNGKAIQLGEWPSKKARDLLKILVARRCRPVARVQLLDLLWPDQGESVASPRLSVALSTVRSVLDPTKQYPPDKFVGADRATIWLDGDEAAVDVEVFLHDARAGLDGNSLPLLRGAEAAYSGDFLEEDVYADWADGMREEARALYVRVARVLAERTKGDPDAAAGYLLRILQRDQYDERAHLGLVSAFQASGAHGEARRAYRTYVQRMAELEVEPAPYPAVQARPVRL
ncbi:ATP/maltotriose-dependent transcriptional regulator MalT [Kribbella orskensis]|uniref:ATP/maltotriose-dependent transcriptional regulator MalT n=1 Tax=Kribbella orskensis TaxID=2512216 RepID=A0ABY2BFI2_9ACTN|nr:MULTISPECIES: tetratricopeptide repeat protein [Kribbella]TCN35535.1 ATP/maltotriose-dependent transcriptional regulator MalT [Kribbella sp. VKM Ac-2500]TCO17077.1 ATP/maltotriose-dependent transcriptional regulator MalT [Kribbella orskensis]